MIATATIREILAAERELGRLDQVLQDERVRQIWSADAMRREALATLSLDGDLVAWDDLVAGLINIGLPSSGVRPGVVRALRVLRVAEGLCRGRIDHESALDDEPLDDDHLEYGDLEEDFDRRDAGGDGQLLEGVRATTADINAFLDSLRRGERTNSEGRNGAAAASPPLLVPLSSAWLTDAWRGLVGDLDDVGQQMLVDVAGMVDVVAQQPGLIGVAGVLHRLHQPRALPQAELRQVELPAEAYQLRKAVAEIERPSACWRFARLLAPWLIQRCCGLSNIGPWVSPALLHARFGYAGAACGGEDTWLRFFARSVADGLMLERSRIVGLGNTERNWRKKLEDRRRNSRLRSVLDLLFERPAVTVRYVERVSGTSYRGAQLLVRDLERLGVLREATGRYCYRLYVADHLRH